MIISSSLQAQKGYFFGTGFSNSGGIRGQLFPFAMPYHLASITGSTKTEAFPSGYYPGSAYFSPLKVGGLSGRAFGSVALSAQVVGAGLLNANLNVPAPLISAKLDAGANRSASITCVASTSGSISGVGSMRANLLIGASPSAIDIADAIWSRSMAPFNEVGTFGYKVKNLTGGGGGGGGGPTADEIADAVRVELAPELARVDVPISSRLATAGYTAPPTAAAIRSEIDANSTKLDVAVGTRLATAGYTAPANADVAAIKAKTDQLGFTGGNVNANAQVVADKTGYALTAGERTAIRTEMETVGGKLNSIPSNPVLTTDSRLNNLDATVSSRLAAAAYTAPPTATQIRTEIDTNSTKLDVAVSTRNAVAPDNAGIAAIKQNTDLIPAAL